MKYLMPIILSSELAKATVNIRDNIIKMISGISLCILEHSTDEERIEKVKGLYLHILKNTFENVLDDRFTKLYYECKAELEGKAENKESDKKEDNNKDFLDEILKREIM